MYQLRKEELLLIYSDITASISKDLLHTKKEKTEHVRYACIILTPELLPQSRFLTIVPYLHKSRRGAFSTIAIAGELEESNWAVYWMVVHS